MQQSARRSTWLSGITAAVLIALLAAFYITTVNNMIAVDHKAEQIKNSPYPVSVAAGSIETLLTQCKTLADRPLYVRTDEAIDNVEQSYAQIDEDLREKTAFIADNHNLDTKTAAALKRGYEDLAGIQTAYIALCRNPDVTDEQIAAFANDSIKPAIDTLLELDRTVLDESSESVDDLYATVTAVGAQTIAIASALMTAVILSLAVYLTILRRNRKQEAQLQEDVRQALAIAQTANAAKSQFLSNMSHDIRTPMNAIVGLTAIASAHLNEPKRVQDCLNRIALSSKHLLGLINDVLDMGKIESGKIILSNEAFSLPDLVSGIVAILQPQARAKSLKLDIVIGNIQQENVVGDSMRLNQALINLVSNAVKYTPEGGSVRLSLHEKPSKRAGCRDYAFVVQATGIGMSPEFLKRIFNPFEREESAATNHTEGTGLGMAITKNVVDMMGGTIEVESVLGEGSTFTATIPLKVEDKGEKPDLSELRGARVLVVDDDPDVLESTLPFLEEAGLRGAMAFSGAEALALTAEAHREGDDFRTIIIDWVMPVMDGVETVRRIREEVGDSTPIILLSAYDWSEIEEEARSAGVTAFVSKPLFKSRLYRVLQSLCNDGEEQVACTESTVGRISGRVLLVEDNELNCEIASELIQNIGVQVESVPDGLEAVDRVIDSPDGYYGLVFMDMQMPRMNGIEAVKTIRHALARQKRPCPPIVAMTANAFNEDRERALAAGMDGFLTKPIDINELEGVLEAYLRAERREDLEAPSDPVTPC